jgi:hypothetical protein
MDPKGKGMVVNDNEKESIFNEPRDDKVNNSGSSEKKMGRRGASGRLSTTTATNLPPLKRTTNPRRKRKRLTRTFLLITLVFRIIPMLICFLFHLVNLLTLMERTTDFGVTKCVVICSLFIQVYGR